MKRYSIATLLIVFLVVLSGGFAQAQKESVANAVLRELTPLPDLPPAPDFTLKDMEGNSHTLSAYRGKVVIVNFWATWCLPCRKEMPSMQRAWEQLRAKDVQLLAVNWGDSLNFMEKFRDSLPPMDFPLLHGGDEAMTKAWSVRGLPTTYVIDPQGRMAYKLVGETEWDKPDVMNKVLALKEG